MVDVADKAVTDRWASARCSVTGLDGLSQFDRTSLEQVVLPTARVSAILGAKKTSSVIPLCHPLPLGETSVEFEVGEDWVRVVVFTETTSETGVEMEALTGATLAALSLFQALASSSTDAKVTGLELLEKRGGRTGTWRRDSSESGRGEPVA